MKKMRRGIALLLSVLICTSLCGCQQLEDMRAVHAKIQEDGSIHWNGNVYLPLENVPETLSIESSGSIMVTDADVPVLLSKYLGEHFMVDKDRVLLYSWYYNGDTAYFCRADRYDFMTEYLRQEIDFDVYCYSYWLEEKREQCYYYLTEDQGRLMDELLNTLDFVDLDRDVVYSHERGEYSLGLDRCDETHLFVQYFALDLVYKKGQFYLVTQEETMAMIPATYTAELKEIVRAFYEAEIEPYIHVE